MSLKQPIKSPLGNFVKSPFMSRNTMVQKSAWGWRIRHLWHAYVDMIGYINNSNQPDKSYFYIHDSHYTDPNNTYDFCRVIRTLRAIFGHIHYNDKTKTGLYSSFGNIVFETNPDLSNVRHTYAEKYLDITTALDGIILDSGDNFTEKVLLKLNEKFNLNVGGIVTDTQAGDYGRLSFSNYLPDGTIYYGNDFDRLVALGATLANPEDDELGTIALEELEKIYACLTGVLTNMRYYSVMHNYVIANWNQTYPFYDPISMDSEGTSGYYRPTAHDAYIHRRDTVYVAYKNSPKFNLKYTGSGTQWICEFTQMKYIFWGNKVVRYNYTRQSRLKIYIDTDAYAPTDTFNSFGTGLQEKTFNLVFDKVVKDDEIVDRRAVDTVDVPERVASEYLGLYAPQLNINEVDYLSLYSLKPEYHDTKYVHTCPFCTCPAIAYNGIPLMEDPRITTKRPYGYTDWANPIYDNIDSVKYEDFVSNTGQYNGNGSVSNGTVVPDSLSLATGRTDITVTMNYTEDTLPRTDTLIWHLSENESAYNNYVFHYFTIEETIKNVPRDIYAQIGQPIEVKIKSDVNFGRINYTVKYKDSDLTLDKNSDDVKYTGAAIESIITATLTGTNQPCTTTITLDFVDDYIDRQINIHWS